MIAPTVRGRGPGRLPSGASLRTIPCLSAEPGHHLALTIDAIALAEQLRRRLGEIDAICTDLSERRRISHSEAHDLRRQCRKADVAARLLDRGDSSTARLRKRIKNLRRRVGEIRDLDVIRDLVKGLDLAAEHDSARGELLAIIARKRDAAADELLAFLRRHPHARLRKVAAVHDTSRATTDSIRRAVDAMQDQWTQRLGTTPSDAHELHAVRLAGKRLASALRLLDAPSAVVTPIEELVAELGQSNDLSVAARFARDLESDIADTEFRHVLDVLDATESSHRNAVAARVAHMVRSGKVSSAASDASADTPRP